MTVEAPNQDPSRYAPREIRLAELVALGLLVVEGLVILGSVAAAIANQVQFSDQNLSVVGAHAWGYTLALASAWSVPWAVAVFLFGPLALVAWMGQREGDEVSGDRARVVLRLELVLAVLTVVGGAVSIVGRVMQVSPPQQWSAFFENLGSSLGSVVLGVVGIVVVTHLADDAHHDVLGRPDEGAPPVEDGAIPIP
jgi:hypothetical protein